MATRAVYAREGNRELFLGYTTSTTDDPAQLIADVLPEMATPRASRWSELQGAGPVRVYARALENGDRWHEDVETNRHLDPSTGAPYLRDVTVGNLSHTMADGSVEQIPSAPWGAVPFTLSNKVRDDVSIDTTEKTVDHLDEEGATEAIALTAP